LISGDGNASFELLLKYRRSYRNLGDFYSRICIGHELADWVYGSAIVVSENGSIGLLGFCCSQNPLHWLLTDE